jgi:hypothetical protein
MGYKSYSDKHIYKEYRLIALFEPVPKYSSCEVKKSQSKPDAGKPPVRFDGRVRETERRTTAPLLDPNKGRDFLERNFRPARNIKKITRLAEHLNS